MLYLLDSYHYYYESFQIYKKHAEYLTLLARAARSAEEKHELYSQALAVYCEACQLADTILYDVHTTSSLQVLSVCLSVCLSVWVYEGHIIHPYNGKWRTCAPGRRNMHHSGAICTTVHKGDYVFCLSVCQLMCGMSVLEGLWGKNTDKDTSREGVSMLRRIHWKLLSLVQNENTETLVL